MKLLKWLTFSTWNGSTPTMLLLDEKWLVRQQGRQGALLILIMQWHDTFIKPCHCVLSRSNIKCLASTWPLSILSVVTKPTTTSWDTAPKDSAINRSISAPLVNVTSELIAWLFFFKRIRNSSVLSAGASKPTIVRRYALAAASCTKWRIKTGVTVRILKRTDPHHKLPSSGSEPERLAPLWVYRAPRDADASHVSRK